MITEQLRQAVKAIEARPAPLTPVRPLAFTLQYRGWRNSTGLTDVVIARCTGLTVTRLRRLYNHELPAPGEVATLAACMDWPADRLAQLVEADRLARAMKEDA